MSISQAEFERKVAEMLKLFDKYMDKKVQKKLAENYDKRRKLVDELLKLHEELGEMKLNDRFKEIAIDVTMNVFVAWFGCLIELSHEAKSEEQFAKEAYRLIKGSWLFELFRLHALAFLEAKEEYERIKGVKLFEGGD